MEAPEKCDSTPHGDPESGIEAVVDDVVDLEEYAKLGKRPPLAKGYRLKVNGDAYVVHDPTPTGREILTLAGLLPAKDYTLRVKLTGERAPQGGTGRQGGPASSRRREAEGPAARPDGGLRR